MRSATLLLTAFGVLDRKGEEIQRVFNGQGAVQEKRNNITYIIHNNITISTDSWNKKKNN